MIQEPAAHQFCNPCFFPPPHEGLFRLVLLVPIASPGVVPVPWLSGKASPGQQSGQCLPGCLCSLQIGPSFCFRVLGALPYTLSAFGELRSCCGLQAEQVRLAARQELRQAGPSQCLAKTNWLGDTRGKEPREARRPASHYLSRLLGSRTAALLQGSWLCQWPGRNSVLAPLLCFQPVQNGIHLSLPSRFPACSVSGETASLSVRVAWETQKPAVLAL